MPRPADWAEGDEKRLLRAAGDAPTAEPSVGVGVEAPVGGAEDPGPSAPPEAVVAVAEVAPPAKMKEAVAGDRVESSFRTFERGDAGGVGRMWPPAVGEAGAEAAETPLAAVGGGEAGRGENA